MRMSLRRRAIPGARGPSVNTSPPSAGEDTSVTRSGLRTVMRPDSLKDFGPHDARTLERVIVERIAAAGDAQLGPPPGLDNQGTQVFLDIGNAGVDGGTELHHATQADLI